ncbi:hypothetical protein LR48_Vigan01g008800 [Vigna angularis]|uniref:DUF668 domain-containing protein n=2 Tax=Phaseolus angularis TaxID=3914 RepID=A0A0L9TK66_PHAAN|nr:protein PSK SIMULATOR 1 [Vigna angularis]KAG2410665.1 uncharacterized protein HKW66_Vig0013300 [Vigna angularis]KOM30534.1 hypothetical protein LR48_Vigan01g008800 [Vigna angularis]BAT73210.1 hypothetical protein VIGAN_01067700 [Vigna angularis var. angularis]
MGGLCSKSAKGDKVFAKADAHSDNHKSDGKNHKSNIMVPGDLTSAGDHGVNRKKQEGAAAAPAGTGSEDFYDGIPRYTDSFPHKSRSVRSRQAVAKVSEVSLRLGRAGIDVLDTLGSSMTNLSGGGFVSGAVMKGNEIGILAFEVANTIVKGFSLMESLSAKSIKHLKEEVLPLGGVQDLVSKDTDELLRIVAADKRDELKIFSDEVIRFGNRSKDPQWHNLDRYFEKISKEHNSPRQSKEEAELLMKQLMTLVQLTAELYHELHALDRFAQDYQHKREEDDNLGAAQNGGGLSILRAELRNQKKQVKHLKKKSLWSRSLEEVMEKLVEMVHFLHLEINSVFGTADDHKPLIQTISNRQRLGPAGLALHYANIVLQIDTLVARSSSMPANTRDALYQSLPPNIKLSFRSKLPSFHVLKELTISDIKQEMEKTLHWLVPIATNTAKAHHGFGWVGEWASTGSELNKKTMKADVMRIETLHHADKDKVENYILELLLWLHRLAVKSKSGIDIGETKSTIKSRVGSTLQTTNQQSPKAIPPLLTSDEQKMLQDVSNKIRKRGMSKSLDFDSLKIGLSDNERLTKSSSYSSTSRSKEFSFNRIVSKLPVIDFVIDKKRALDVIDRLDVDR